MKKNHIKKHRLKIADCITVCRIAGTLILFALRPLSTVFFIVYSLTGLTDVLDGWIARKTETADSFGARLDSIADMLFYAVMLFRIFPVLWNTLPSDIWYAASGILVVRISAYLLSAVKYRQFASMHTYLNKLTGVAVFIVPFMLTTEYTVIYCRGVCAVAAAAALEELIIYLSSRNYNADTKSIFKKRNAEHENTCF